jgi:ribosome biogenesis protein ERB1
MDILIWKFQASYDLWGTEQEGTTSKSEQKRLNMHLSAPKASLPLHAESYNPPAEYLFDKEEMEKWEKTEKEARWTNFAPKKYDSLRRVPFYEVCPSPHLLDLLDERFVQVKEFYDERIERCLDLHLAPRQRKMKVRNCSRFLT